MTLTLEQIHQRLNDEETFIEESFNVLYAQCQAKCSYIGPYHLMWTRPEVITGLFKLNLDIPLISSDKLFQRTLVYKWRHISKLGPKKRINLIKKALSDMWLSSWCTELKNNWCIDFLHIHIRPWLAENSIEYEECTLTNTPDIATDSMIWTLKVRPLNAAQPITISVAMPKMEIEYLPNKDFHKLLAGRLRTELDKKLNKWSKFSHAPPLTVHEMIELQKYMISRLAQNPSHAKALRKDLRLTWKDPSTTAQTLNMTLYDPMDTLLYAQNIILGSSRPLSENDKIYIYQRAQQFCDYIREHVWYIAPVSHKVLLSNMKKTIATITQEKFERHMIDIWNIVSNKHNFNGTLHFMSTNENDSSDAYVYTFAISTSLSKWISTQAYTKKYLLIVPKHAYIGDILQRLDKALPQWIEDAKSDIAHYNAASAHLASMVAPFPEYEPMDKLQCASDKIAELRSKYSGKYVRITYKDSPEKLHGVLSGITETPSGPWGNLKNKGGFQIRDTIEITEIQPTIWAFLEL